MMTSVHSQQLLSLQSKMCGSGSMETDSKIAFTDPRKKVNLKMPHDKIVSENPRKMKPRRRMSNDPQQSVKVFCAVCDQVYQMSGLRKHVAHKHGLTLTRYREMYGDLRKQIIQLVHHACVLCKQVLLLDTEDISKHVSKKHKMGYRTYATRHMEKGSGIIKESDAKSPPSKSNSTNQRKPIAAQPKPSVPKTSPPTASKTPKANLASRPVSNKSSSPSSVSRSSPTPSRKKSATRPSSTTASPSASRAASPLLPPTPPTTPPLLTVKTEPGVTSVKHEPMEAEEARPQPASTTSLVIIQCDVCFKIFSKNIQLKAHKKKNHL